MAIPHSLLRLSIVFADGRRARWQFSVTEDECGFTRATNILDSMEEPKVFAQLEYVEPDGSTTPWLGVEDLLTELGPIPF